MDTQPDKNKQKEAQEQLKALEKEVKMAFKSGQFESVIAGVKSIKTLDPENRFAENLARKVEALKKKEEVKAKEGKVQEYKIMLKKLFKDHDAAKLKELAVEFGKFAPGERMARLWLRKAEKLGAKPGAEKTVQKEKIEIKNPLPTLSADRQADKAGIEAGKEKKPAVLTGLFKKPETGESKPVITAGIMASQTKVKTMAPKAVPVVVAGLFKKPEAEASKSATNGNIFTRMFGKKEEEAQKKSIIDTIVASGEKKEKIVAPEKGAEPLKPEKPKDATSILVFSRVFMNFCIIFIALSAAFLYVEWVDKANTMLSLVGVSENTGAKLYNAAEEVNSLAQEETDLNKEIELYKGGYDDKTFKTVQNIIAERINWPDIFAKINEVTNSVYELNDFFKYIEYNNYSFDAENGTIRVTGTLSDPLGRNLTKLVELEEAFKYYPKDQNNPDDKTLPYFTGFKEFTSFSKTLDKATGRYTSSFQLSFSLNK